MSSIVCSDVVKEVRFYDIRIVDVESLSFFVLKRSLETLTYYVLFFT